MKDIKGAIQKKCYQKTLVCTKSWCGCFMDMARNFPERWEGVAYVVKLLVCINSMVIPV